MWDQLNWHLLTCTKIRTIRNLFHIFWSCPAIQLYWQEIIRVIQNIFDEEIYCSFTTIYLGNIAPHLLVQDKYFLKFLATSKKAVTWKLLQATDWIDIVTNIQKERKTFLPSLRMDKNVQYWEKLIVFVSTRDVYWAITVWMSEQECVMNV